MYNLDVPQERGDKMGRPKAENPKDKTVKARLDKGTYDKFVKYCQKSDKTKTDVIREGIEVVIKGGKGT